VEITIEETIMAVVDGKKVLPGITTKLLLGVLKIRAVITRGTKSILFRKIHGINLVVVIIKKIHGISLVVVIIFKKIHGINLVAINLGMITKIRKTELDLQTMIILKIRLGLLDKIIINPPLHTILKGIITIIMVGIGKLNQKIQTDILTGEKLKHLKIWGGKRPIIIRHHLILMRIDEVAMSRKNLGEVTNIIRVLMIMIVGEVVATSQEKLGEVTGIIRVLVIMKVGEIMAMKQHITKVLIMIAGRNPVMHENHKNKLQSHHDPMLIPIWIT
jgi:hypothetical protein